MADVTLDVALTANGLISVYGGNITVNRSLTSNGSNAAQGIYLKAIGQWL